MKSLFKNRIMQFCGLATLCMSILTSCGTVANALSGGKRPSFIVNAPKDVIVKLEGKQVDLSSEIFAASGVGNVTNTFYSSAVNIPFKKPVTLEISSESAGKTALVELKPKRGSVYFWGNLIFAPIVGHIIDGVTDNNKVLSPKFIDVESVLNNIPFDKWPSQNKLKRIQKSKAKKNTTKTTTY